MKPIVDRNLEKRSKLSFYFPMPGEGKKFIKIILPFFENITLSETKRARLAKYSPLSRSSDLYTYLGANSRAFSLEFNITLPHIEDEHRDLGISFDKILQEIIVDNPYAEQQKFFTLKSNPLSVDINKFNLAETEEAHFLGSFDSGSVEQAINQVKKYLRPDEVGYLNAFYEIGINYTEYLSDLSKLENDIAAAKNSGSVTNSQGESILANFKHDSQQGASNLKNRRRKAINLIAYWINIIRASVSNNSRNPILGPPILRLTHGILYQDVPCICTDYSLRYDESGGYDMLTLLPRVINVSLNLEEIRTGDFTEFDPKDPVKRDNLVGYEVLLNKYSYPMTQDPGTL